MKLYNEISFFSTSHSFQNPTTFCFNWCLCFHRQCPTNILWMGPHIWRPHSSQPHVFLKGDGNPAEVVVIPAPDPAYDSLGVLLLPKSVGVVGGLGTHVQAILPFFWHLGLIRYYNTPVSVVSPMCLCGISLCGLCIAEK